MFGMRKVTISMLVAVWLGGVILPSVVSADGEGVNPAVENLEDWGFYKPVQMTGESPYKSFFLDEEVYRNATVNLADLRMVDVHGNTVPYYIETGYQEELEKVWQYESRMIKTIKKDNNTIIDFQVLPLQRNEDIQGNILQLSLPEENFLKHVKVEGGYDGNRWELIGKDYVYRMEQRVKDKVELPSVLKYTYYRITILDNAENVTFSGMNVLHSIREEWKNQFEREKPIGYEIKVDGQNTIILIRNPDHLRIREIKVEAEGNFQREFELYVDQAVPITEDNELYSLNFTGVNLADKTISILGRPVTAKELKLVIDNRDDSPLSIGNIVIGYTVDKLVFEDKGSAEYRLLFGNDNARQPQYDFAQFKHYVENEKQDAVRLGPIVSVEKPTPPEPVSRFNKKYLFNGVIIAVSIMLVFILARKLNGKSG